MQIENLLQFVLFWLMNIIFLVSKKANEHINLVPSNRKFLEMNKNYFFSFSFLKILNLI